MVNERILVIEDDMDVANVLEAYLLRDNFNVAIAGNGIQGLETALSWKPHLILLDVMLPGMNGTDLLSALRKRSDVPVIMVTAMGDEPDRIGALRYGADDYVVKPYNPGEVVARVQAVLRRAAPQMRQADILRWQGLEVDTESLTTTVTEPSGIQKTLELTPTEFALLV